MNTTAVQLKKEASRWKWFLLTQKYRFDLGYQFLALMNFTLLLIAASDKLRYYTNIPRTWILILAAVPTGFFGMWMFGLFLDKVVRYGEGYSRLAQQRNPFVLEQTEALKRIEGQLQQILDKKG